MSAIPMPLEPWLQMLVEQWVLTPLEASSLQDFSLTMPEGLATPLPPHLHPLWDKIALHRLLDETATLH